MLALGRQWGRSKKLARAVGPIVESCRVVKTGPSRF